jgi:hypothetical protein
MESGPEHTGNRASPPTQPAQRERLRVSRKGPKIISTKRYAQEDLHGEVRANEITRLPGNFRTRDKILILSSDSTGRPRDLLAQKTVVSPNPFLSVRYFPL